MVFKYYLLDSSEMHAYLQNRSIQMRLKYSVLNWHNLISQIATHKVSVDIDMAIGPSFQG